jgi:hypothetical protein
MLLLPAMGSDRLQQGKLIFTNHVTVVYAVMHSYPASRLSVVDFPEDGPIATLALRMIASRYNSPKHRPLTLIALSYKRMIPPNELQNSMRPLLVGDEGFGMEPNIDITSSPYAVSVSGSMLMPFDHVAGNDYQAPLSDRTWAPEFLWEGYGQPGRSSQSSISSGSTALLQRQGSHPQNRPYNTLCIDVDYNQDNSAAIGYGNQLTYSTPFQPVQTFAAAARDRLELTALTIPGTDLDLNLDFLVAPTQQRYVAAYWADIHPLFPVLHRDTFESSPPSPLLKTAVMALGAQSLGEIKDSLDSRILHERCVKVLRRVSAAQLSSIDAADC